MRREPAPVADGIAVLDRVLREAVENEALLEDAATSLLRVVQEDEGAGDEVRALAANRPLCYALRLPPGRRASGQPRCWTRTNC